jgi:beta-galactosidase
LRQQVLYKGEKVLDIKPIQILIPAGGQKNIASQTPWSNPKLWTPYTPDLYQLKSDLIEGENTVVDTLNTRFGFREFGIKGDQFTLNGNVYHPYGGSATNVGDIKAVKLFKSKNETYSREWFFMTTRANIDMFDEVGCTISMESNQDSGTDFGDPRTFVNWGGVFKKVVDAYRNNASIMFWNFGNEIIPEGKPMDKLKRIGDMMKEIKAYDPTRVQFADGTGDVGGFAETYTPHYPNGYVLPDDDYWLGTRLADIPQSQIKRRKVGWNERPERIYSPNGTAPAGWPRTKPMFAGEFSFHPTWASGYGAPWLGDEAYCPGPLVDFLFPVSGYKALGFDRTARFDSLRILGISGFCAHTTAYSACSRMNPIEAVPKEFGARVFGGQTTKRTLICFNNLCADQLLTVSWSLSMDGKKVISDARKLNIKAGGSEPLEIELNAPSVSVPTYGYLNIYVDSEDGHTFDDVKRLSVFPNFKIAEDAVKVAIYDPQGDSKAALESAGIVPKVIDNLTAAQLTDIDLLVIGENAATDAVEKAATVIKNYVSAGGHVLVLRQEFARPWLPLRNFSVGDSSGSVAAITAVGHPLLKDLSQEDFHYWNHRIGSLVYSLGLNRPRASSYRAIVSGGHGGGGQGDCNELDNIDLLEVPLGKGWYLCSQLELTQETIELEPAARTILRNIVNYTKEKKVPSKTALLTSGGRLQTYLEDEVGLVFDNKSADIKKLGNLSAFGAISICDMPDRSVLESASQALHHYVSNGGCLVIHSVDQTTAPFLKKAFNVTAEFSNFPCPRAVKRMADPLFWGISNNDLAWKLHDHNQSEFENRQESPQDIVRLVPKGDGIEPMTYPAMLTKISVGKGQVILDTGRWVDRPQNETILSTFDTTVGAGVRTK